MIPIREGLEVYRPHPIPVSWKIPAFCCNDWLAIRMLQLCEAMGIDKPFHIVYGAPRCAWSGGRPSVIGQQLTEDELDRYFKAYEDHGVRVALTFSRLSVDPGCYDDAYCKLILEVAARHNAEVILFDDGLADVVHELRPGLRLISSLNRSMVDYTKGFRGMTEDEYYRWLLKRYDEVVIRCDFCFDEANIAAMSDVVDRFEVIVNQTCVAGCRHVYEHVSSMENWDGNPSGQHPCFYSKRATDFTDRLSTNLFFSNAQVDRFAELGLTKMKLAGRNAPPREFIDMLGTYIFEPTGVIKIIRTEMSREYREAMERAGGRLLPFTLPEDLAW